MLRLGINFLTPFVLKFHKQHLHLHLMYRIIVLVIITWTIVSNPNILVAQVGGKQIYSFLNLPTSPRMTALGGNNLTVSDDDLSLSWNNPALINTTMSGRAAINYNFHLAKIKSGFVGYADSLKLTKSIVVFGLDFIGYGDFDATDVMGNITGTFVANEYAFQIGTSKALLPNLTAGANLKIISSRFEAYNSFGFGFDLGIYYDKPEKLSGWGFVVRNLGLQLSAYQGGNRENLPFDIQLGYSKSLKHLPFRFSAVIHHLHRWNLLFDIPDSDIDNTLIGLEPSEPSRIGMTIDNIFRHVIFNGEFLLGANQNLILRFGYNHMRKKEMTVSPYRSFAGFSAGFAFRVKTLQVSYGFGTYHLAGSNNHIGISTSLDNLFHKKKIDF